MKRLLVTALLAATAAVAHAGIVYNVNQTIGNGTVTGFIETDGSLGAISFGNFIDFELTLSSPNFSNGATETISKSDGRSYGYNESAALTATLSELAWDPSGNTVSFIIFWDSDYSHWWCLEKYGCSGNQGESIGYGVGFTHAERNLTDQKFVFASNGNNVPEPATLTLVAGALLGMGFGRFQRNQRKA